MEAGWSIINSMSTIPENTSASNAGLIALSAVRIGDAAPAVKRWNREEYYRLAELGWFQEERVELIDGEILVLSPQSFSHYWSIDTIGRLLDEVFGEEYWVRSQAPCTHGEWSEPEPDVSVVRGIRGSFTDHPTTAILAVEVSKTTLRFDKGSKANLYASMGVPDYWVLDLEKRQLLVHRQPVADESVPFGHRYENVEAIPADGHVSPLEKPDAKLTVAEMLPPKK
jgi:Uma2 family endonuclease